LAQLVHLRDNLAARQSVNPSSEPSISTPDCPAQCSDILKITDSVGNVLNDIFGNPAIGVVDDSEGPGEPNQGITIFMSQLVDPLLIANPAIGLTEPSPSGTQPVISDLVSIEPVAGIFPNGATEATEVQFESFGLLPGTCALVGIGFCTAETQSIQDVTNDFFGTPIAGFFHVLVQSDVSEVPEPGTLLLLASGIAGLVMFGRPRRG
jgi:hypothetical protein